MSLEYAKLKHVDESVYTWPNEAIAQAQGF